MAAGYETGNATHLIFYIQADPQLPSRSILAWQCSPPWRSTAMHRIIPLPVLLTRVTAHSGLSGNITYIMLICTNRLYVKRGAQKVDIIGHCLASDFLIELSAMDRPGWPKYHKNTVQFQKMINSWLKSGSPNTWCTYKHKPCMFRPERLLEKMQKHVKRTWL